MLELVIYAKETAAKPLIKGHDWILQSNCSQTHLKKLIDRSGSGLCITFNAVKKKYKNQVVT